MRWLILVSFLPLLGFRCDKEGTALCLQGKIVRVTCASVVVQVLNNDTIGQDGWTGTTPAGPSYDNVFMVENRCELNFTPEVGQTFYFNIGTPNKVDDCIICMLWDAPPTTKLTIRNLSEQPCTTP